MANETAVQTIIHKLEEGHWKKWVGLGVVSGFVIYVCYAWLFQDNGFKGLSHPRAIEQAVIARELARGHGFSTRIIRPAERWLFQDNRKPYPVERIPDTYHAPLWPAVLSPFVGMAKKSWKMTKLDLQYTSDRVIAGVGLAFLILSVTVNYFVAKRLFDARLAQFGTALVLLCNQLWLFAVSGLPQMLMLFLFSLTVLALIRLVEVYDLEQETWTDEEFPLEDPIAEEPLGEGEPLVAAMPHATAAPALSTEPAVALAPGVFPADDLFLEEGEAVAEPEEVFPPGRYSLVLWAAAAGAGFGLLALTHAITVWLFVGALLFALTYLPRGRWRAAAPMLALFLLFYTPWLARNYMVCGSPAGVSWFSGLSQLRGTESSIMRGSESPVNGATPTMFRRKVELQLEGQLGGLPRHFGNLMVAPVFFISLLHLFKRKSTGRFRWCVVLMWISGVLGMAIFGLDANWGLESNNLHLLFIPVFTFYGMAYILVLWSRLDVRIRLLRVAFLALIFVVSGLSFFFNLLELHLQAQIRFQWPPYFPPYIAILGDWTSEREIIMSDMPWAVAWYADRRSLWLTETVREFNRINDFKELGAPIAGLYLTPVSGNAPFIVDVVKGEYKEWAPFIQRLGIPRNFPFREHTPLPIQQECIFYSDRNRWSAHED